MRGYSCHSLPVKMWREGMTAKVMVWKSWSGFGGDCTGWLIGGFVLLSVVINDNTKSYFKTWWTAVVLLLSYSGRDLNPNFCRGNCSVMKPLKYGKSGIVWGLFLCSEEPGAEFRGAGCSLLWVLCLFPCGLGHPVLGGRFVGCPMCEDLCPTCLASALRSNCTSSRKTLYVDMVLAGIYLWAFVWLFAFQNPYSFFCTVRD